MKTLILQREASSDAGTFGILTDSDEWSCYTAELPWRENRVSRSCIPAGVYKCNLLMSPRFKKNLYSVSAVPGRSGILIHSGNWAGDIAMGLRSDVEGCILLGTRRAVLDGQPAVANSGEAMAIFSARMGGESFMLEVRNAQ